MRNLFKEMDAIADAARAHNPLHSAADDQIAFRQLQEERYPDLTKQQWLELFDAWCEHYVAKLTAQRDQLMQSMSRFTQMTAWKLPSGAPFVCVCGEEIDPSDPAMEADHRPHCWSRDWTISIQGALCDGGWCDDAAYGSRAYRRRCGDFISRARIGALSHPAHAR
jgi:hypothetical protein